MCIGSPFWFGHHPNTEIRAALHAVLARGVRGDGHGWEAGEAVRVFAKHCMKSEAWHGLVLN